MMAAMPAETRRARHLALAMALEAEGGFDPAILARQFQEAGDRTAAARHMLAAAEQASRVLAFDRAAQFYRLALDHGRWHGEELVQVQCKLATALVQAERGTEAAHVYLEGRGKPAVRGLRAETAGRRAVAPERSHRRRHGALAIHRPSVGRAHPIQAVARNRRLLWQRTRVACHTPYASVNGRRRPSRWKT